MTLLALALFLQDATPDSLPSALTSLPSAAHSSALGEMLHNSGPTAITVLALLLLCSIL